MDVQQIVTNNWPVFERMGWKSVAAAIANYRKKPDELRLEMPQVKHYQDQQEAKKPFRAGHEIEDGKREEYRRIRQDITSIQNLGRQGFTVEQIQQMVKAPDGELYALSSIAYQLRMAPHPIKEAVKDIGRMPNGA